MATEAKNTNYWISSSALYIQLNAMGEPDYIQCSVVSGASILCYMQGIPGLEYDAGHNYQRWPLAAYPSIFPNSDRKYIYVAIPRVSTADNNTAIVVYPSERIDLYGYSIENPTKLVGNEEFYYIYLQGIISEVQTDADGKTRKRDWIQHVDCGRLNTDESLSSGIDGTWWRYNSITDSITFLKTILSATFDTLIAKVAKITQLFLGGSELNGVANELSLETDNTKVVTPQYLGQFGVKHFLAKDKDDVAHGAITFEKVQKFLQGMDIGDNAGQWTREGVLAVFKFLTNNFEQGLYGHGAQIDEYGNIEANSIFARQFISAPKFVFNEISVTKAEQWNTNGYGTIKSVNVKSHTITLKLEENDYGSLSEGDICRGIYADIENTYGSDANNEGEMDDCGFTMHRGFFTTYFYVKKIITAEKGKFVFEYGKRSEGTPDPCAFMDFAQYGNFTDEKRQSSMYFCSRGRSYIEVLDGVNTWEIQAENRVTRYGWLGGLRVKKTDGTWENLRGNGLFAQNNVYLGGAVITLSQIKDLDSLKLDVAAYDVTMSQPAAVITVDDLGNVINGLWSVDEAGVKQYRISTAIFAHKGENLLLLEDEKNMECTAGHYRVYAIGNGCDVKVENGVVFLTGINKIKDGVAGSSDDADFDYDAMRKISACSITIVVELEGKVTKNLEFPVRIHHDSLPFMVCDLSNENASIAWNTKTAKYIGLPITTKVSLMYQNTPWEISDLSVGAVNGLKASISLQGKEKVITIDADNITSDILEPITKIPITVVGVYAGVSYEYTKELTILRSADMIVYDVVPSVDSVVVDKDGNLNTKTVSCKVYATSSDDKRYVLSALPSGYQLKYGYGDTADTALALGGSATASTDHTRITFALYDNKGSLLDQEMVPIVSFGKDGKGIEYIFKRTTNSTSPGNPTPSDWRTNAEYLRTDKEYVPSGWTDDPTGVDAVNLYEWVSKRVSVNGHWGEFSDPAEYAHFGKHAAKATLSDYTVTIPTDSEGNSLAAFSEDISCTLVVDGKLCSSLSVSADSLPSGVSISGTTINVSYAKGYALGKSSKVAKVKVSGKLDNSSYSDTITLTILPNISGMDGKGIEYIFKRTTDSTPPDNPTPSDWRTNAEYLRTDKEYIPSGWTDDPTGVDAVNLYEWVSKRVSVNGHWGEFSDPAEYAHFGKHAARATLSDYIVTIPTDPEGNSIAAFSEDISCTLLVDGNLCSSLSVSADSLPSGVTISGTTIKVSYAKGYAFGRNSKVVKVKVSGKLDNASYSDTITLTILPNVSGVDGDGYEYVFYLSNSSTPPSKPSRANGKLSSGWVDDPPSPTDANRYVYVSYYEGKVGAPDVAQGLWSAPALWAYKGKNAAKATLSDYLVTIPTDTAGKSIAAFSEDISCTLLVDGNLCSSLSVSADSLPSGVTISGTTIKVSYEKGYSFGRDSKVVKVKVSGKLDNASYSDTITLAIVPNISGVDGDGYEYVFYLSNSSTPPSKPSRSNGKLSSGWVDDPPSPTDDNRYVYVSYYEGKVGSPNVAQGLWSSPSLWAYKAPKGDPGKHAAQATLSDYLVTIPTDTAGKSIAAFSEDISCTLLVDGNLCSSLSVSADSLPSGVTISGTTIKVSYEKGYSFGRDSKVVKVKVSGKLDNASYSDTITLAIVPNISGVDGDGYEYVFYLSNSSTPPSKPSRSNGKLSSGWVDDPPSPTEDNRYVYVSYYEGKVGAPNVAQGLWSAPSLWAYKAPKGDPGKHAAKATLSDYLVTIPTDTAGKSIAAFSEDISCTLLVDGNLCSSLSVSADSLPSGVTISGTTIKVSYEKGYSFGRDSKVVKVKVSGKLDNSSYSDTITLAIVPNISGVDGDGYEYVFYLSNSSTPPSKPSRSNGKLSSGWVDDPPSPTDTNRYVYVSYYEGKVGSPNVAQGLWSAPSLWAYKAPKGEQGVGNVTSITVTDWNESTWNNAGTYGTVWTFGSDTSSKRNGCRVGDLFTVTGTATDTKNAHTITYKSLTDSGALKGSCLSHSVAYRGEQGGPGGPGGPGPIGPRGTKGPIQRIHDGFVTGSYDYSDGTQDTDKFIDIVVINGQVYYCSLSYRSSSPSVADGHWTQGSNFELVATKLLLAENATITMANSQQINIVDGNTLWGSFRYASNNDDYALWLGASNGASASFAVTRGGAIKAMAGQIGSFVITQRKDPTGFVFYSLYATHNSFGIIPACDVELNYHGIRVWSGNHTVTNYTEVDIGYNGALDANKNPTWRNGVVSIIGNTSSGGDDDVVAIYTSIYPKAGRRSYALRAPVGDVLLDEGAFIGALRPNIKEYRISAALSENECYIICTNSSSITLTLPSNPRIGQLYFVYQANAYISFSSTSSHPIIVRGQDYPSGKTNWYSNTRNQLSIFIYGSDGRWYVNYMNG